MNIDKIRTTPYKPSTNGQVERLHRTLNGMLARVVRADQRDWCSWLPSVMAAYRATPHESTGHSPNAIMFGRENCMPIDIVLGTPDDTSATPQPANDYVYDLHERLNNSYRLVREHLGKAASRRKARYDVGVKESSFQQGDWVWYSCPRKRVGLSPKMQRWYDGPYLVVHVIDSHTLVIQRSRRAKPKVVHKDKVKQYLGDPPVSWLRRQTTGEHSGAEEQLAPPRNTPRPPIRSLDSPQDTAPEDSTTCSVPENLQLPDSQRGDMTELNGSAKRRSKMNLVVEPPVTTSRARRKPDYLRNYVCEVRDVDQARIV